MPAPNVQFRPHASLEAALTARADRNSLGWAADRDLARYYTVLATSLRQVTLTEREASLIVDAANGTLWDADSVRLLWAEIDDAIRHADLAAKHDVDGADLVRRIRDDWTPAERLAVVDACERYWSLVSGGDDADHAERLRQVGLVR